MDKLAKIGRLIDTLMWLDMKVTVTLEHDRIMLVWNNSEHWDICENHVEGFRYSDSETDRLIERLEALRNE